ncbi:glycosyltransferase [Gaoshiqia sp. Z1-71]|uniref:glycosyltransferase n=1 Tax=Gaoshiqia hydrogeniformans TaxID=3290090 RepID=UPI003BF7F79C
MKILLINNCHYRRGGADVVYFNTAQLLKQYGHEVFFFSTNQAGNEPYEYSEYFASSLNYRELSVIEKIKAIPRFVYNRDAGLNLLNYISKIEPDVVHIHLFLGGLSTAILKALRTKKIPVVVTVHDYRLICPAYLFLDGKNNICEACKDQFYLRCSIRRCSENNLFQSFALSLDAYFRKYMVIPLKYIDQFIFVSNFTKDKHTSFNPGYKQKGEVLYNFVPVLEKIEPINVPGDYFLFYGRLSREKGIHSLVNAATGTDISLKIVGEGPLFRKYKDSSSHNIKFFGYKSGDELWNLVKMASFIVVPSECYENNPMTILEAYSYGKPVIGSRIGGIPEIIEHGRTGFLFEHGNINQLKEILESARRMSPEQYRIMSENARQFADTYFSPALHYDRLISIYKRR